MVPLKFFLILMNLAITIYFFFLLDNSRLVKDSNKDMILDIRAKTEIDDIDVFVSVSGILAQPMVTFSSSPVLSESEIISLLMFNKNYLLLSAINLNVMLNINSYPFFDLQK